MKVKQLQWEKTGNKFKVIEIAPSLNPMKPYKLERSVSERGEYYCVTQGMGYLNTITGHCCFDTDEEAKKVAQQDYEHEVLKHLESEMDQHGRTTEI